MNVLPELLWLLLPLAAASGWWAARRAGDRERGGGSRGATNPAYFRGLNYLLNEEPDKAIDVFVKLLEVDSETVETHLALGSLFRRRGEVERAIRIHQNLIARPALTREQRGQALLELGQDYMRAGLYDRAENLFLELKDMRLHTRQALRNLRVIYEQERDWNACLKVAEELEPLLPEPLGLERSHYYCELALLARQQGDLAGAQANLKRALQANRNCIRSIQIQAELASSRDDCATALKLLKQAAAKAPEHLPEVLPAIGNCYRRLGDLVGLRQYLDELPAQGSIGVILAKADLVRETEGEHRAAACLSEALKRNPSLKGLLRLIELNASLPDLQAQQMLIRVREQLERLLKERPMYQCQHCGFSANTMHWQCPSCRHWSSMTRMPEAGEPGIRRIGVLQ
jgi:lipopolysaccharide biosynthesis regulator YciM